MLNQPDADTLHQNQFGGTVGGPHRAIDRTFFFGNYEGAAAQAVEPLFTGRARQPRATLNAVRVPLGLRARDDQPGAEQPLQLVPRQGGPPS